MGTLMPRLDQILLTDPTGAQTLIDMWESGEVEVSWRAEEGDGWCPSEVIGINVNVKRGVQ